MMKQAVFTIISLLLVLSGCSSQAEKGLKPKLSAKVKTKKPLHAKKAKRKKPPPKKKYPPYSIHDPKIKKKLKYYLTKYLRPRTFSHGYTSYGYGDDPIGPSTLLDEIIEWFKAHEAIAYPALVKMIKDGKVNTNHIMLFSGLVKEKDIPLLVKALESTFEGFDARRSIGMKWYRIVHFILNNLAKRRSPKSYEAVIKLMHSKNEFLSTRVRIVLIKKMDPVVVDFLKKMKKKRNLSKNEILSINYDILFFEFLKTNPVKEGETYKDKRLQFRKYYRDKYN